MAAWFEHLSIRTRVVLLTLLIALPAAGMLGWLLAAELQQSRDAAYDDLRRLATGTATNLQHKLAQSETELSWLAVRPLVRALNPKHCDPIVAEFVPLSPEYLRVEVRDAQGRLICPHLPNPAPALNAAQSLWFQQALLSNSFKASGVALQVAGGRPLMALSYPIRGDAGSPIGLLVLVVDLLILNQQLLGSTPGNAVVTVVDTGAAILLHSAEPQTYIGARPSATPADPPAGVSEGFRTATGSDGVVRLFALSTVPVVDWRVSAGVPRSQAFARYDTAVTKTLLIGLGVLLLAVLLVWRLSTAIVVPISRLRLAASRVTAGEETVRAEVSGPPEIRALAQQFNQMLDARALSEARLRGIFETAIDAILSADAQQLIVQANPAAAKMFRCPVDALIGMPLERFIAQPKRAQHRRDMQAFSDGNDATHHMGGSRVVTALRADGEAFPIDASVSHLSIAGLPLYTVILRDVSERSAAQQALRNGKARLEAALSSMNDAVFITDLQGRLIEFNDAFASFHRFSDKGSCPQALTDYLEFLDVLLPNGEPAALAQWAVPRALRGEKASNVEYRLRRKDSGEAWVGSFSFAPIRSPDGEIVGSVVTARDVTAVKQARADLEASHAALQRLIAARDSVQEDERARIARELHDDLQQTLAAIRINLGELGNHLASQAPQLRTLAADTASLAAQAIVSTRRIVSDLRPQMLDDLGLGASLEVLADQVGQYASLVCKVDAAEDAVNALNQSPQLAISLFRVAQEALNNVVKHARASKVDIHLALRPDRLIALRVVDNGRGIRAQDSQKIDSFGILGMRERVRAHGGSLSMTSLPGGGTALQVLVALPDAQAPVDNAAAAAPPATTVRQQESGLDLLELQALREQGGDADALARLLSRSARHTAQDLIDALAANVAVLGSDGVIRLVNRAWHDFGERNGQVAAQAIGPGVNYLEVCRRSAPADDSARRILQGLTAVFEGQLATFCGEYPCHSPDQQRWFRMHVTPMASGDVLVTHYEIAAATAGSSGLAY